MKCYVCDQVLRDGDFIEPVTRIGDQPRHWRIEACVAALARELKRIEPRPEIEIDTDALRRATARS